MVVARHIAVAEEGCNPVFGGAHIGLSRAVILTLWERRIRARIIWAPKCNTINSRVAWRGTPVVEVPESDPFAEPQRILIDPLVVCACKMRFYAHKTYFLENTHNGGIGWGFHGAYIGRIKLVE